MLDPTEHDWSRFHRIREGLSKLSSAGLVTRIEQLREGGESPTVISLLELHYRLAQPAELPSGRRLANRYTIKAKIGEGGMGVVYEAVQELTHQEVALKVIHPALVSAPLVQRFRDEIRTLGKLQHDHIVRVFDAGIDRDEVGARDLLFYAMQLVRGLPLTRWVRESHPTIEARLDCFIRICEAVHYAHCHGVIHRDLKPDNILVDAGGRPAILDFGLAQIADVAFEASKGSVTAEGKTVLQMAGTPAFMSPERWDGHPGGVPADVFALGVLLYEILTGARPWAVTPGCPLEDLETVICGFKAEQLRGHPALSGPLTRLVGSMLASDPAARPDSAAEVAGAIRAVLARRRLERRIRRAAPVWVGVGVAVVSVIATQGYHGWRKKQEQESQYRLGQASQIVRQRDRADVLVRVLRLLPPRQRLRHSQDEWRDVVLEAMSTWNIRMGQAVPLPGGFEPMAGTPAGTRFFGRAADGAWELVELTGGVWVSKRFPGARDLVTARVNPRQSQVAVLSRTGGLLVWDWGVERLGSLLSSVDGDTRFEFSPDGRHLACSVSASGLAGAGGEGLSAVRVYETGGWAEVGDLFNAGDQPEPGTFLHVRSRPVTGLAFSPDGQRLAVWSQESSYLLVWEWSVGRLVCFARHTDRLAAAAWRPDPVGLEVATLQANGQIRVWEIPSGMEAGVYLDVPDSREWGRGAPSFQGELFWVPGGEVIGAVDEVREEMVLFAAEGGRSGWQLPLGASTSGRLRWLFGGFVMDGAGGREWVPFELERPIRRMVKIPDFSPSHLTFHPAGTLLAAADNTRMVFLATTSSAVLGEVEMPLSGPVVFDAVRGDFWVYNKTNGPMHWTVSAAQGLLMPTPLSEGVRPSYVGQLAAGGGHLAFSRGSNIFVQWRGEIPGVVERRPDIVVEAPPQHLAISADGRRVAVVWGNPVRAELWGWRPDGGWVSEMRVTDGPVVVALPEWNRDSPLTIRPAQQRTAEERGLASHPSHFGETVLLVAAVRLPMVAWLRDPDRGVHLDYLGRDGCVHVATLAFDREHAGVVTAIALSPDGMWLAAANSRGEIHLWDLRRALGRLVELQLGIEEIGLDHSGSGEESPNSLIITGPGQKPTIRPSG
jgi:WD40 repeat protein